SMRTAARTTIAIARRNGGLAKDCSQPGKEMGLAPPPGEGGACRVVEHGSHERPRRAGQPPGRVTTVEPMGDTDIGEGAKGTDCVEREQAFERGPAAQALVPIGELIVEDEVGRHGGEGGGGLRPVEVDAEGEGRSQYPNVHDEASGAHERKEEEANGEPVTGQ